MTTRPDYILSKHWDEWLNSAVDPEIIAKAIHSAGCNLSQSRIAKHLGWKRSQTWMKSGWLVQGVDPRTGEATSCYQFKPDEPRTRTEGDKVAPIKYESQRDTEEPSAPSAGTGNYLTRALFLPGVDWAKITGNTEPIWITEGAKKAGAIVSQGRPAICLFGVWNGQKDGRLIEELELLATAGRRFYLAFDADLYENPNVYQALCRLSGLLQERGSLVSVVDWNHDHKGIDDHLASLEPRDRAGAIADLEFQARTWQEWRKAAMASLEKARADRAARGDDDDDDGRPRRLDAVGILEHLAEYGDRLSYNVRSQKVILDHEELRLEHFYLQLAAGDRVIARKELAADAAMRVALENPIDPVLQYLESVERSTAPGDIDHLADTYFGTKDLPNASLYNAYIKRWLIGAVQRAYEPGSKFDSCLILKGHQGFFKSSFLRALAGADFFTESIEDVTSPDDIQVLYEHWIAEIPEIDGALDSRKGNAAVKKFFSNQVDQLRPAYGRERLKFPRRSVVAGTTNEDEFLLDRTGNRRYWVCPVLKRIDVAALERDRHRIWAGAIAAYRSGVKVYLSPEEEALQRLDIAQYEASDPWDEPVMQYLKEWNLRAISTQTLLTTALKIDLDKQNRSASMRVAGILKRHGWTQGAMVREGDIRYRPFLAPESQKNDDSLIAKNLDRGDHRDRGLDQTAKKGCDSQDTQPVSDSANPVTFVTTYNSDFIKKSESDQTLPSQAGEVLKKGCDSPKAEKPKALPQKALALSQPVTTSENAESWQLLRHSQQAPPDPSALWADFLTAIYWASEGLENTLKAFISQNSEFVKSQIDRLNPDQLALVDRMVISN
jgi:predicted P-loop ATPase